MINPNRVPFSALVLLAAIRPTRDATTPVAPPRSHFPPTRRERLQADLAAGVEDVLAAQNRLVARQLGVLR